MRVEWFNVFATAIAVFMTGAGATWWLAPERFVRVYRKVAFAEKAAKTVEWERAVRSVSGRMVGVFMLAFGCVILWLCTRLFVQSSRLKGALLRSERDSRCPLRVGSR
jgi:hypothetical protein